MEEKQDQLYVKLEGYENLLEDLDGIDQVLQNIREAMDVLEQVRDIKQQAIYNIDENMDQLHSRLSQVNSSMPTVEEAKGQPEVDIAPAENVEIDDSVQDLRNELDSLKSELSNL